MTPHEIIALRAPQFSTDGRLNDLIALAETMTGTEYETLRNYAVALLVMHWLTLETIHSAVKTAGGTVTDSGVAVAGGITSESEGSLSHSFGGGGSVKSNRNPDLASTQYGLELLALRDGLLFLPRNRMM